MEGETKTGGGDEGLFLESSSSELIFSIPPAGSFSPGAGGSGGRGGGASTSCGGRGGAFSGGRGGREMLSDGRGGFFTHVSLGLRMIVLCVLMDIPESILDGVQGFGNTGDPNPPVVPPRPSNGFPPGASTLRTEYWKSWGKLVLGNGSFFTIGAGVMGVVAVLWAVSISASLLSGTLSVVELLLVLRRLSSESLTEPFPGPAVCCCCCCLAGTGFLSSPHFFSTGSRYFFKWSPRYVNSKNRYSRLYSHMIRLVLNVRAYLTIEHLTIANCNYNTHLLLNKEVLGQLPFTCPSPNM